MHEIVSLEFLKSVFNVEPSWNCTLTDASEVLKEWQMTKDSIRSESSLTYEEIIWNNRKILINGKSVFYKRWFDHNIIRIQDLYQEDDKFLSFKRFCDKFKPQNALHPLLRSYKCYFNFFEVII